MGVLPIRGFTPFDEGTDPGYTLARLADPYGIAMFSGHLGLVNAGWDLHVYDLSRADENTAIYELLGQPYASIGFPVMQYDGRWKKDRKGFNMAHYLTQAALGVETQGGHIYLLEYVIHSSPQPLGWNDILIAHEMPCIPAHNT